MSLFPLLMCFFVYDPLTMSFHLFAPSILLSLYLCEFLSPLSTISTKGELKLWIGWGETMRNKDHCPNLVQFRLLTKDI